MTTPTTRIKEYFIGLDLGQRRDYSAIALVSALTVVTGPKDPYYCHIPTADILRLEFLEQCPRGLKYSKMPRIIAQLRSVLGHDAKTTLAADATGPGLPVVETIKNARLPMEVQPYIITSGGAGIHQSKGVFSIGRETLLSSLRIAIETKRIRFPKDLRYRMHLNQQLLEASLDASQAKSHDDLVFAIALAVVSATTRNPSLLKAV